MRHPRWLGIGIVAAAFIGGTASAAQQDDKKVDEAFIQQAFADWFERDNDAKNQRTSAELSAVEFTAADLKLADGDKLTLTARAPSSVDEPAAKQALRGLVVNFLDRQFPQKLSGLGMEEAELKAKLDALKQNLVVNIESEKVDAEPLGSNSGGIDQPLIQRAFADWFGKDLEARARLERLGLASASVLASHLTFIEPDKLTLRIQVPASVNVPETELALRGLVVDFLRRQFDQVIQKQVIEQPERDKLLAALEKNLVVQVAPEKVAAKPNVDRPAAAASPQASPQALYYASPQALSKVHPLACPPIVNNSGLQRVAARPVFGVAPRASLTPEAHYSDGLDHYWAGRYADARDDFAAATAGAAKNPSAWYFKGLSELALGDQLAAQASVDRGAAIQAANGALSREVGLSLVRVQGPTRIWIERALRQARSNADLARAGGPN